MHGRCWRWGAVMLLLAPLGPMNLRAEPYLALRTGLKCAQCHVNRTGGGGRNDFGSAWAQTQLPARAGTVRSRGLNDWVAIGLDLRARASGAITDVTPRAEFDITDAQVQLEARLIPNRVTLYVDQTLGPQRALSREVFGLVDWGAAGGYVKAGKFLLPYGWRLWDDDEFIRSETGFTYLTPDVGVELGVEPGPLSWWVSVTNGTVGAAEGDDGKMVTSSAVVTTGAGRLGASGSYNRVAGLSRWVAGGLGGARLGRLTLLGEADWVFEQLGGGLPDRDQLMAYAEGDLLLTSGVNAKLGYGFHDPDIHIDENERVRIRAGVEVFPIPFVQLAAFFIRNDNAGEPDDLNRVSVEMHVHF